MSEIPFVNALGDEVERAAAARIATRRRRIRRRLVVGAIGFAVAATGVAAASGVLTGSPEQLATTGIGCYSEASLDADVSILSTGDATPIETCRRVLHADGPLVACAHGAVLVFPGGPGTCEKLGLEPLPAAYTAARKRVNRLARKVTALEESVDCWTPHDLAARVQATIDGMPAWRGWRAKVTRAMAEGPCGTVTHLGGVPGEHSIDGALDPQTQTVMITLTAARSTLDLLFGRGGAAAAGGLSDSSAERCYDRAGAERLARDRFASSGRTVTVSVEHFDGESTEPLQSRLDEGCAVIAGIGPAADGYGIAVTIRH